MIRLLQHYTPNFKPLIDISKPIHEAYCKKHGYSFHLKEVPQYEVYNGLEKLNQILEVCENGDIALVMDADAMVTNLLFKVERFLEYGKDLYFSQGLNCGVFIIIKHEWTTDVIRTLISGIKKGAFNCEQDGIEIIYRLLSGIKKVHQHPCFNSYLSELYPEVAQPVTKEQGQWGKGCFVLHLPALLLEQRINLMKEYSQYIIWE